MNNNNSKTDFARLDAMKDEDIVYDDDTGAPWTTEELHQASAQSFAAHGLIDFKRKRNEDLSSRNK